MAVTANDPELDRRIATGDAAPLSGAAIHFSAVSLPLSVAHYPPLSFAEDPAAAVPAKLTF